MDLMMVVGAGWPTLAGSSRSCKATVVSPSAHQSLRFHHHQIHSCIPCRGFLPSSPTCGPCYRAEYGRVENKKAVYNCIRVAPPRYSQGPERMCKRLHLLRATTTGRSFYQILVLVKPLQKKLLVAGTDLRLRGIPQVGPLNACII